MISLYFLSKLFSAAPSAFLYPSPQRVLIHQDTLLFGWEQGSFMTWFPRSLSSRLRSRTRLWLLSPRHQKRNSVNLIGVLTIWIDCRTFLGMSFPRFHSCQSRRKNIYKKRLRFSFLFPPFRLQSLPPWWMRLLFPPLLSPLLLLSFLQIVLTSEKADSMWLSVSDLAPHFLLFPQRFSNNARLHVRWPVTALLEGGGGLGVGLSGFLLTQVSLQTLYFHECTAELCFRGLPASHSTFIAIIRLKQQQRRQQ